MILNLLDVVLTVIGVELGRVMEANPVVVEIGFLTKMLVVSGSALVIDRLGYGRWLWVCCLVYGAVVSYTAIGLLLGW